MGRVVAEHIRLVVQQWYLMIMQQLSMQASIMGFSMGGHGALTIGLTFPDQYKCISALAPVCSPASSLLGLFYYSDALGPDKEVRWLQPISQSLLSMKKASKSVWNLILIRGYEEDR